jgi:hypothetical protein
MRVDVTPRAAEISPGIPLTVTVNISNTSNVIGGYSLRVLGADPSWVDVPDERISLFPDETGSVTITFTPPEGLPAGTRVVAIQVREWTPPEGSSIVELELTVPSRKDVYVRVDPLMVTAGKQANFGVIVENTGNTVVEGVLAGDDPEAQARFEFEPETVYLVPGERALVDMRVRAKRRIFGLPTVRVLGLFLDDAPTGFFAQTEEPPAAKPEPVQPIAREEGTQLAFATFVQKPVISRGLLSLAGLLAAVTVFAIVITIAMSRLVSQSAADRDLALQVAAARNQAATGTAAVSGTVRLLTTGAPVPAVSVNVFSIDNVQVPVATTATNSSGQYRVANLAAGAYKISYRGAGFVQIWYPGAADDSSATPVVLTADQNQEGVDVLVGGVPATVTGKVTGDDVSASTLYLMKPTSASGSASTGSGGSGTTTQDNSATPVGPASPPDNGDAIVQQIPVGSDGTFSLENVPSPSVYDLVVTKVGYATATQRIDIGAGETRSGLVIALAKGDGLISGIVNSPTGPLGGATISATTGTITVPTVSLSGGSTGAEGTFTLRGLPTPASFTVTASANGYASQTQTVTLAAGQKLTGLSITLSKSSGTLSGVVTELPSNQPAGDVQVTITNGQLTVQTQTQSAATTANSSGQVQSSALVSNGAGQAVGHWTAGGLPIPGTYTVTFSRSDLASQTVGVSLDSAGNVTQGSQGATVNPEGLITVAMKSSTAVVEGVVKQCSSGTASCTPAHATTPVGEVTVTLSSGTASYTVTTASVPSSQVGHFRVGNIPPGTWTVSVQRAGTSPTSTIITLRAGDDFQYNPALAAPASISGSVVGTDGTTPRAGWWVYIYRADQYPTVVSYSAQTDATGHFAIPAVDAPENYVIVVQPTSAAAQAAAVTRAVKASENVSLTIKADPAQ